MRKMVSQCNTADFKLIEHLVKSKGDRPSSLTKKQKLAVAAVFAFAHAGLTFPEIYAIREIIFWDDGTWEYRFHHLPEARAVMARLQTPTVRSAIQSALKDLGTKQ